MEEREEVFTISVLTENKSGLLNAVTIIFTRKPPLRWPSRW